MKLSSYLVLTGGDTHILCVACLGEEHPRSALEGAGCEHCDLLPLQTLRSRLAFFHNEGARFSQGSGPAVAEAQRRLQSWSSQMDLSAGLEMGTALSLPSHYRSSASSQGWEARAAVSSAPVEAQTLQLSDSEELDIVSLDVRNTEDSPPQSRAYEELVEVVIRAVDWPAEREDVRSKNKKKTNASCLLVHTFNGGDCDATPRCRDRGINRFPIEFIVHKHLTIPL